MEKKSNAFIESEKIEWKDLGNGLRRKILGYDPQLMTVLVEFKKGAVGPLHSHAHTQASYIVSGSFEVQIKEDKKILKAGDVFFIPSNYEHGVVALEESVLIDVFTPMREDFLI